MDVLLLLVTVLCVIRGGDAADEYHYDEDTFIYFGVSQCGIVRDNIYNLTFAYPSNETYPPKRYYNPDRKSVYVDKSVCSTRDFGDENYVPSTLKDALIVVVDEREGWVYMESHVYLNPMSHTNFSFNYRSVKDVKKVPFPTLKSLEMTHNQIKAIDEHAFDDFLDRLEMLDLSFNELNKLPEFFTRLVNLKTLKLAHNKLTNVPKVISSLDQLKVLDLSGNGVMKIKTTDFMGSANLEELNLDRINMLEEDNFKYVPHLKKLNISVIELKEIPEKLFEKNTELERLHIGIDIDQRTSKMREIPEGLLRHNKKLKYFGLDNAKTIGKIPDGLFVSLRDLKELVINTTGIRTVTSKMMAALVTLERLVLTGNDHLSSIDDDAFAFMHNLNHVDLHDNALDEVPRSVAGLRGLAYLDISKNSIRCDCSSQWLLKLSTRQTTEVKMWDHCRHDITLEDFANMICDLHLVFITPPMMYPLGSFVPISCVMDSNPPPFYYPWKTPLTYRGINSQNVRSEHIAIDFTEVLSGAYVCSATNNGTVVEAHTSVISRKSDEIGDGTSGTSSGPPYMMIPVEGEPTLSASKIPYIYGELRNMTHNEALCLLPDTHMTALLIVEAQAYGTLPELIDTVIQEKKDWSFINIGLIPLWLVAILYVISGGRKPGDDSPKTPTGYRIVVERELSPRNINVVKYCAIKRKECLKEALSVLTKAAEKVIGLKREFLLSVEKHKQIGDHDIESIKRASSLQLSEIVSNTLYSVCEINMTYKSMSKVDPIHEHMNYITSFRPPHTRLSVGGYEDDEKLEDILIPFIFNLDKLAIKVYNDIWNIEIKGAEGQKPMTEEEFRRDFEGQCGLRDLFGEVQDSPNQFCPDSNTDGKDQATFGRDHGDKEPDVEKLTSDMEQEKGPFIV